MTTVAEIRDAVRRVAGRYGVSRAYLFGSYARGEQREGSDVDILVELSRPLGFKRAALSDEVGAMIGEPVDVVFGEGQLYPHVRESYERERVDLHV